MSGDHQARLRASGERLAYKIKTLAGVRSVLLTASTDRDAELLVWWDTEPPTGPEESLLDGVDFRIEHRRAAVLNEWLTRVTDPGLSADRLTDPGLSSKRLTDPGLAEQRLVAAIRDGVVLHDSGLIPDWRARTDDYPEKLALATVRAHLDFRPPAHRRRLLDRGDLLLLAQDRLDTAAGVLLVLLGLNRVWFPGFQGLYRLAESLPLAPAGLPARLEALFTATAASAVPAADALIRETLILVAQHMPNAGAATALGRLSDR